MGKVSGAAGLVSVALTGLQIYNNFKHYGFGGGLGRSGVDIVGLAAGAGVGAFLATVGAGTVAGVIVCTESSIIIGGLVNKAKEVIFQ